MQTSVKFWSVISIGMALCAVPLRAEVLYMANTDGNSISAYQIEGNGTLTQVAGSPFPSGKSPVSVKAFGRFLYASNMGDDTIWTYRIGPNGALTRLAVSNAGVRPNALAVDPFGRFLYVTNYDSLTPYPLIVDHVSSYRIGVNGTLTPVGSPSPAGMGPDCAVADPLGRFVYAGNAGDQEDNTETVSGYRVGGNGLIPLTGSPFPDGESPQAMAIDPFGRFVYTAGEYDIALVTDRIAENGTLTKLTDFFQDDGYQFWNTIAADPLGRFVYHFSAPDDSFLAATLSVYRVGTNGLTLGASYQTGFLAYSMIVDLSGQFLFLGGISVGYGVSTYRVGANGSLTPLTSLPLGFAPTAMAVSSSW